MKLEAAVQRAAAQDEALQQRAAQCGVEHAGERVAARSRTEWNPATREHTGERASACVRKQLELIELIVRKELEPKDEQLAALQRQLDAQAALGKRNAARAAALDKAHAEFRVAEARQEKQAKAVHELGSRLGAAVGARRSALTERQRLDAMLTMSRGEVRLHGRANRSG